MSGRKPDEMDQLFRATARLNSKVLGLVLGILFALLVFVAALAALPGFTLPGDISASTRFYARDIVIDPITISDGHVTVPTTPGLGFDVDREFLDTVTTSRLRIDRRGTVVAL